MAHPLYIVDQFVRHFFVQWQCGLKPMLNLETQTDGAISISYNVTVPVTMRKENMDDSGRPRKRSGHLSRSKRKKKRRFVSQEDCSVQNNMSSRPQHESANVSDDTGDTDLSFSRVDASPAADVSFQSSSAP